MRPFFLKMIIDYLKYYYILTLFVAYFLISTIVNVTTGINFTIPCIWHLLFDVHCPGCGLTKAFMNLMQLDIQGAWKSNPLIFFIIPAGLSLLIYDFKKFKAKATKNS